MTDQYLRVGNYRFNHRYIKSIYIDDDHCELTIANTESSSISITGSKYQQVKDVRKDIFYEFLATSQEYKDICDQFNKS